MTIRKIKRIVFLVATFLFLVATFQNCGEPFNANDLPSVDEGGDVSPPNGLNYILPTEVVAQHEDSKLDWNFNSKDPEFHKAVRGLSGQCERRINDFVAVENKYSDIVYNEGLLPNDPMLEQMKNVRAAFDQNMNVAFCAYFAPTESLREHALNTAVEYLENWNTSYVGDGNPINERFFIHLFIAADLLFPLLSSSEIANVRDLATRIYNKEVAFISNLNANDGRLKNNWKTTHLMILTFASIISNNTNRLEQLKTQINANIIDQYTTPSGFALSECQNLRSIGAYGSYDLQQRDAFTYHLAGILHMLPLLTLNPSMVNATSKTLLLQAIELTKPYVLSQKQHPEFQCTTVQYDRDKIAIDPTVGHNWDAYKNNRVQYRYIRIVWPETKSWTSQFLTAEYNPWLKILYTGKGDVLL